MHRRQRASMAVAAGPQRIWPLREELPVVAPFVTVAALLASGHQWEGVLESVALSMLLFCWLFAMIVVGATSVVRHADHLALKLGEPYGTMILTLSVASIEIFTIVIVMTTGAPDPTLARDTMFSVVMIVLNGLVGVSLLLGGLRYHEQEYNLKGVTAYLS